MDESGLPAFHARFTDPDKFANSRWLICDRLRAGLQLLRGKKSVRDPVRIGDGNGVRS